MRGDRVSLWELVSNIVGHYHSLHDKLHVLRSWEIPWVRPAPNNTTFIKYLSADIVVWMYAIGWRFQSDWMTQNNSVLARNGCWRLVQSCLPGGDAMSSRRKKKKPSGLWDTIPSWCWQPERKKLDIYCRLGSNCGERKINITSWWPLTGSGQ